MLELPNNLASLRPESLSVSAARHPRSIQRLSFPFIFNAVISFAFTTGTDGCDETWIWIFNHVQIRFEAINLELNRKNAKKKFYHSGVQLLLWFDVVCGKILNQRWQWTKTTAQRLKLAQWTMVRGLNIAAVCAADGDHRDCQPIRPSRLDAHVAVLPNDLDPLSMISVNEK